MRTRPLPAPPSPASGRPATSWECRGTSMCSGTLQKELSSWVGGTSRHVRPQKHCQLMPAPPPLHSSSHTIQCMYVTPVSVTISNKTIFQVGMQHQAAGRLFGGYWWAVWWAVSRSRTQGTGLQHKYVAGKIPRHQDSQNATCLWALR